MPRPSNLHGRTLFFARRILCACIGATLCHGVAIAQVALTVDASKTVNIGAGTDDLATLKSLYQDANAPQDFATLAPLGPMIGNLQMKRMRILQSDVYTDLDSNGNFITVHPNEWDSLTSAIDWAAQNGGLSVHIPVAFSMPESFTQYGTVTQYGTSGAASWPQTIITRYKSFAQQLVRYVIQRSYTDGLRSVIFEVGNELDIGDDAPLNWDYNNPPGPVQLAPLGPWGRELWWIDSSTYQMTSPGIWGPNGYPFNGDTRRITQDLAPLQKIFADAIASVQTDTQFMTTYPVTIQFAGPATATYSFQSAAQQETLEELFLDYMFNPQTASGQYNISKLDYVSFHYYGDFQNGWSGSSTTSLKYETNRLLTKLASLGQSNTKIFLSEWGPSTNLNSDINYSNKGAAWAAAFLNEAVADQVALGSYLIMDDAGGTQATGTAAEASLVGKVNGAVYPKPPANVFQMFTMMTGTRNAVTGLSDTNPNTSPNLGAFAASDASSAGIVVYNYNSQFADDTAHQQTFTVEFDHLPFSGTVTVEQYLVDAQHSNFEAFLANPTDPNNPALQMVATSQNQVTSGTLVLPQPYTLGLGVTYWRIHQ